MAAGAALPVTQRGKSQMQKSPLLTHEGTTSTTMAAHKGTLRITMVTAGKNAKVASYSDSVSVYC